MKHPTTIEKYNGTLEELANDIGNLRYDCLAELFQHIHDKIIHDCINDFNKGRKRLAADLEFIGSAILSAANRTWDTCIGFKT